MIKSSPKNTSVISENDRKGELLRFFFTWYFFKFFIIYVL